MNEQQWIQRRLKTSSKQTFAVISSVSKGYLTKCKKKLASITFFKMPASVFSLGSLVIPARYLMHTHRLPQEKQ
jgi:hypothetical protein